MKSRAEIVATLVRVLPTIRARYPVGMVQLFGSCAREEQAEGSDVDLAVEFVGPLTYRSYMALKDELGDALGAPVDLADRDGLKPRVRERLSREAVTL